MNQNVRIFIDDVDEIQNFEGQIAIERLHGFDFTFNVIKSQSEYMREFLS